jgi:hypothetical protein
MRLCYAADSYFTKDIRHFATGSHETRKKKILRLVNDGTRIKHQRVVDAQISFPRLLTRTSKPVTHLFIKNLPLWTHTSRFRGHLSKPVEGSHTVFEKKTSRPRRAALVSKAASRNQYNGPTLCSRKPACHRKRAVLVTGQCPVASAKFAS